MKRAIVEQRLFFTPFSAVENDESVRMIQKGEPIAIAAVEDRRHFFIADVVYQGMSGSVAYAPTQTPWRLVD
jgi:hypothetical protein